LPSAIGSPDPVNELKESYMEHFQMASRQIACAVTLFIVAALLAPAVAIAQSAAGDAGSTLWSAFRAVLYGPWGLVGSAVVVGIGIYMFVERGFMHALGVMAAGALLFFVPLIVVSMRNTAQALGGAG
jgi:hypothetical protein